MIIFDQLRISDDGKKLFIDAHVSRADFFVQHEYSINSITIATAEYVPETVTLSSVSDFIYKKDFEGGTTEISLMLQVGDLTLAESNYTKNSDGTGHPKNSSEPYASVLYPKNNFSGPLFFVWIECSGTYSECTPCYADEPALAVTFDDKLLYQKAMGFTKSLAEDCTIPDDFIDFILNYSAFKSAVETDHFCDAKTFYKQLFDISTSGTYGSTTNNIVGRGCGCHG